MKVQLEIDGALLPARRMLIGAHPHVVKRMLFLAARLAAVLLVADPDALHDPAFTIG